MKGRKSLSFSCGAWKNRSCVWIAGMCDTAKQDNMMGLCLLLSSIADSKSAYKTTGAAISNRWLANRRCIFTRQLVLITSIHLFAMCLYFLVLDSSLWSKEVTEPSLHVSCEMIRLCIALTKDAMFEIAQILDVQKVLGNFFPSARMIFTIQRERAAPFTFGLYTWELVNKSYLFLELSLYSGNKVILNTLSETFNNDTPNTLYLSGCFHHLLYTLASLILRFAIILCPPSLAKMRHRCRYRLSSILGLTTVYPRIKGVWCL